MEFESNLAVCEHTHNCTASLSSPPYVLSIMPPKNQPKQLKPKKKKISMIAKRILDKEKTAFKRQTQLAKQLGIVKFPKDVVLILLSYTFYECEGHALISLFQNCGFFFHDILHEAVNNSFHIYHGYVYLETTNHIYLFSYVQGKRHGLTRIYDKNGRIQVLLSYTDGRIEFKQLLWNSRSRVELYCYSGGRVMKSSCCRDNSDSVKIECQDVKTFYNFIREMPTDTMMRNSIHFCYDKQVFDADNILLRLSLRYCCQCHIKLDCKICSWRNQLQLNLGIGSITANLF